ncbi:MAG: hypothetical protein ABI263_00380 [Gelidibacter sp.]
MNIIKGIILHKESGLGIENLIVTVIDIDVNSSPEEMLTIVPREGHKSSAERLGSVMTDSEGVFSVSFDDAALQTRISNEKRPNISIQVLAPEDASSDKEPVVLYKTIRPRKNAGRAEAFIIKISSKQLIEAEIEIPGKVISNNIDREVENEVIEYARRKEKNIKLQERIAEVDKPYFLEKLEKRKEGRKLIIEELSKKFHNIKLGGVLVKEGESIEEKSNLVITDTIARVNQTITSGKGVPVNLYLTPSDRERLSTYFMPENLSPEGFAIISESDLGDILFRTNSSENPGTLLIKNSPFENFCKPDSSSEKCAKINTEIIDDNHNGTVLIPEPIVGNPEITSSDIPKYVSKLINSMPSPDSVLNPDLENRRPNNEDVANKVNNFSLNKGPADMTAFYDFNYLQIAFEHVWKQLFDEKIIQATQSIKEGVVNKFGIDMGQVIIPAINSLDGNTGFTGPAPVPLSIAKNFDITEEEFNLLYPDYMAELKVVGDKLNNVINDPSKNYVVQKLREQGEQLIDRVRLDDYGNLHKTLRDLKERLASKYEFTVYAANKDFHYVNFGLLNTYRQQWTPLNYQVGKLLSSKCLSPKEEQTYSLKVTRNEKKATKEANKNSSSSINEQSSTSKVESEIVKKAQNKTNFSLATEGDYDIWIAEGKVTSNFGIEAQSESSENRKDMRDSVLKATQEYKDEISMEVNSEENSSYEYNESGKIVNPNDELTVTYLFYELQRRFRLSEQLYRVMPVVLVAQEVPSPDQITEAWVISNDWIINRSLLDDSFRSILQYISNKSVGDDFAIRELRKNLRQQRSLIETLRIELSVASSEAANRYEGLENAIENRIGREAAENTDSWFGDVKGFFGGSDTGEDPEAAKARELAAQDAHRYSVEKSEKAAAALRQEINNMNALTNEYNKSMQSHLDSESRIKRLLVHIRNNILYYMQSIWKLEPPDQRFLRLHNVKVASLELGTMQHPADSSITSSKFYFVDPEISEDIFRDFREKTFNEDGSIKGYTEKHKAFLQGVLKTTSSLEAPFKPLVQVADLDNLLGFKGNYMIFPLKEHNALTEFMAAPYVDNAFGAMDPNELSNVSFDEYSNYVCCLHKHLTEDAYNKIKPQLKKWLELLLADPLRNRDEITVPTNSLFIEALPGSHTLLEDFKLRHRKLDVFKVQAEVRKMELENIRYAARLLNEEREDPDVDKRIIVEGNNNGILNPSE